MPSAKRKSWRCYQDPPRVNGPESVCVVSLQYPPHIDSLPAIFMQIFAGAAWHKAMASPVALRTLYGDQTQLFGLKSRGMLLYLAEELLRNATPSGFGSNHHVVNIEGVLTCRSGIALIEPGRVALTPGVSQTVTKYLLAIACH